MSTKISDLCLMFDGYYRQRNGGNTSGATEEFSARLYISKIDTAALVHITTVVCVTTLLVTVVKEYIDPRRMRTPGPRRTERSVV